MIWNNSRMQVLYFNETEADDEGGIDLAFNW